MEVISGLSFLAAASVFLFIGREILYTLVEGTQRFFLINVDDFLEGTDYFTYTFNNFSSIIIWTLVLILLAATISLITGFLQTKFLFTLKPLKFDLSKLDIINGIKRMFSLRSLFELGKAILKLLILGLVGYTVIRGNYERIFLTSQTELLQGGLVIWSIMVELLIKCSLALLIISVADYYFSRYEYEKNLRMTKQEVKEEFKEVEGNPEIKRKQRQIMMQFSMHRMMQQVPEATVVVTNPTHFAVALKYDPDKYFAPLVVAKGVDNLALRIIKIAKENGVPVVRNPKLAREIYYTTEVDDAIPEKLYRAVAEVLAYVYNLRKNV